MRFNTDIKDQLSRERARNLDLSSRLTDIERLKRDVEKRHAAVEQEAASSQARIEELGRTIEELRQRELSLKDDLVVQTELVNVEKGN